MSLSAESGMTQIHLGNSAALQHLDLGFPDLSRSWRATVREIGEVESDPPFQDFTATFAKLQEWEGLRIHTDTRLQAVEFLESSLKNDDGLWSEAAKATLTGKIYDVRGSARSVGSIPFDADTMSPWTRLTSVQQLVTEVVRENVPGDFLEAGVWRGGTCIFVRALLNMLGAYDRTVWVADSFRGLPPPSIEEDFDATPNSPAYWPESFLATLQVSRKEVENRFRDWGLSAGTRFVEGFFNESIPRDIPFNTKLSILRADGDLYESTMDILFHSYHMLQPGGFFICDDCGEIDVARKAVVDFRRWHGITEPITNVDGCTWYWRKRLEVKVEMGYWKTLDNERQSQTSAPHLEFIHWVSAWQPTAVSSHVEQIGIYWEAPDLRPLLVAFAQVAAAALDNPYTRSVGILFLSKTRELLWRHGPSHSLLLIDLALAKLLHADGRYVEAFEIADNCGLLYGDLNAHDLAIVRSTRSQAFKELDIVLSHGSFGFAEKDSAFFGRGCYEELFLIDTPGILHTIALGIVPYSSEEIVLGPTPWKQKLRNACLQKTSYYALVTFRIARYMEQLANHSDELLHWRRVLERLSPQPHSLQVGMCLPSACVADAVGLQLSVIDLVMRSLMLQCQCRYVGIAIDQYQCPFYLPEPPAMLTYPRWHIDFNITFDPGGMPDLGF